jgi:hypothetical protein
MAAFAHSGRSTLFAHCHHSLRLFAREQSDLRDVRTKLAESPLADEELAGDGVI